jgi:GR25 family glycosyltransferase involved in LPS biosynthesis
MDNIDHFYYINLDFRIDRDQHILKNIIYKLGLKEEKYTRISAVDTTKEKTLGRRSIGCAASHLKIWNLATKAQEKYIMVIEDDFSFIRSVEEIKNDINKLFKYDKDFQICNVGYNNISPLTKVKDTDFLYRCDNIQTTSCYILNMEFSKKLIPLVEEAIFHLSNGGDPNEYALDQIWKKYQKNNPKWYLIQRSGIQMADYSDIEQRFADYGV